MDEPNEMELANNITAEYALSDVLDYIFQYLKIKDLSKAASVCQLWHAVASKEMSKRGPERILIPSIFSKEFEDSNFHVSNLLNVKPYAAILFVGPSLRERSVKNLESEILSAYERFFPHYLIAVGVDESMMDERVINSCPGLLGTSNGILGLFLPSSLFNDLNIKLILDPYYKDHQSKYKVLDVLPDVSKNVKPVFILFGSPHSVGGTTHKILNKIKNGFAQRSYTLWGGLFDDSLNGIICKQNCESSKRHETIFLCLTSPSLESWSTVIDCIMEKEKVDKKLSEFRDNIQFKRNTVGLVCGPRYVENLKKKIPFESMYKNSHELMHVIRKYFPNIPFAGIFNYGYHHHFGVDSTSKDNNQKMAYEMAISILILSYN